MTTTAGVKLECEMRDRLRALARGKRRSTHWLMREAIRLYVESEEEKELRNREALARWERYQATGQHVDDRAVAAWLETWGTGKERKCPGPR